MIQRIKHLEPLPDFHLLVTFDDGKIVNYDVGDDIRTIPSYQPLATVFRLFEQVQLDQSRTCVYWNDEIDLPSDMIYEYGKEVHMV